MTTTIDATIGGAIRLHAVPPRQTERILRALSFPNPEFVMANRIVGYTGNLPERIYAVEEHPNGDIVVPRGAWQVAKDALARDGWTARVAKDERVAGREIAVGAAPGRLRDYQGEGVEKIAHHLQGLIVLPCGCGKTRLGASAVHRLRRRAIVVVHTIDLADQWVAALMDHGIGAGRVDGDSDDRGADAVVATVQTLARIVDDPIDDDAWLAEFGLCVLDEAHHAPAVTFRRVLSRIPARWRLGLTATPDREDGLTRLVTWSFGPTLLERDTREMIKLGFLMRAEIVHVETAFRFEYDGAPKKKNAALDKAIVKDEARNAMIADLAAKDAREGETVLVLTNRKPHARALAKMISERGVEARAVISATGKKKRRETIGDLRGGELRVMVATSLADEGLDVQRLSRVILAWPQRARGGTQQRVGRALRDWPGKKPKVYDVVDPMVPTLRDRAAARRTTYRKLGLLDKSG